MDSTHERIRFPAARRLFNDIFSKSLILIFAVDACSSEIVFWFIILFILPRRFVSEPRRLLHFMFSLMKFLSDEHASRAKFSISWVMLWAVTYGFSLRSSTHVFPRLLSFSRKVSFIGSSMKFEAHHSALTHSTNSE